MYPVLPAIRKVEVHVTDYSGPYSRQITGEIKIPPIQADKKGLRMGVLYDNAEGFARAEYCNYVVKWYGEPKDAKKALNELR
jgi:hypothetical protein